MSPIDRSANEGSKNSLAMKRTFEMSRGKCAKDPTDIKDVEQVTGDFGGSSQDVHDVPFEDFEDILRGQLTAWNLAEILDPGHFLNHKVEKGLIVGAGLISLHQLSPCVIGTVSVINCLTTV